MERKARINRKTAETDISLLFELDTEEPSQISSGVPFFDHMLSALTRHGRFRMELVCKGDTHIDDHHSVEDIGICMGLALQKALGNKAGIARFGSSSVPMDESLARVSLDLSGRAAFRYTGPELTGVVGAYAEELTAEFLRAFAANALINLHVEVPYAENRHHLHEAVFKALAVALRGAVRVEGSAVPSTKGVL